MQNFYFTFGYGTDNRNHFVKLSRESYAAARESFVAVRGDAFAFQYTEAEFAGQPEKYNLHEIPL